MRLVMWAVLLVASVGGVALAGGEAVKPGTDAVVPDDPGCVGKFSRQMCPLPDGSGGVCAPAVCGKDRPCLRCMPARMETTSETPWVPMIALGITISIVGFVFWFRLRGAWSRAAQENKDVD